MSEWYAVMSDGPALYHHGILGQKWGLRRWQNSDGSLTPEGRIHYGVGESEGQYSENRKKNIKETKRLVNNSKKKRKEYKKIHKKLISGKELSDEEWDKYDAFNEKFNTNPNGLYNQSKQMANMKEWTDLTKNKNKLLKNAKEKDVWDMNFLEMASDDTLQDPDLLYKDYERFLSDPGKFMRRRYGHLGNY